MPEPIGDIRDRVRRHNRAMAAQAIGCAAVFPLLLAISFGLMWWVASAGLLFWVGPVRASRMGAIVAGAVAITLIFEAIRLIISDQRTTPDTSATNWDQIVRGEDSLAVRELLGGVAAARVITEAIFCAPRALARAVRAWGRIIRPGDADLEAMRHIMGQLEAARGWLPVRAFGTHVRSVVMLQTLDLVWIKPRGDEVAVRINPSFCP